MNVTTAHHSEDGWSLGGLLRVEACPACGSASRRGDGMLCNDPTIKLKHDLWNMQQCATCDSLYLDPRPDPASLLLAYQEYETHCENAPEGAFGQRNPSIWALVTGYLNRRFKLAWPRASPWGWAVFRIAIPWRQKLDYYCRHLYPEKFGSNKRLLDAGCGNGGFLVIAKEMGWDVLGVDPDPVGIEMCHSKGVSAVHGTLANLLPEYEGAFDAVTMSHSIEHLDDMQQELIRVFRLLQPEGALWLATPNPESLGARWFGRAWRGLRPPYHLCIPSQQALLLLLRSSGFTHIQLLNRGVHARRAFRETADNAKEVIGAAGSRRVWLAPFISTLSDLLATVSVAYAEETVIIARKPCR